MPRKVMVAMSGGVDSSMAAALLVEQGFEVVGATMKLFSNETIDPAEFSRTCCSLADIEDARRTSYRLGFDHFVFNFGERFQKDVIDRFASDYLAGKTPNPCIDCNRYLKFDKLFERAKVMDCDFVATGHYARIIRDTKSGRCLLQKGKDPSKDQSYVLHAMTQDQLRQTLFPLGEYSKNQIRQKAQAYGLTNAAKPDSQDICFVRGQGYGKFIEEHLGISIKPGDIVDHSGNILGTHQGLIYYTVGQRKGLGLSPGYPLYVIAKDAAANQIVIGKKDELYRETMIVEKVGFSAFEKLNAPLSAQVKIRYRHKPAAATLIPLPNGTIEVHFIEPQRAIAPGQAAVFYDGETVLGGGTIAS